MHHDIGTREFVAYEELTRGLGHEVLQEVAVLLELRVDEGGFDFVGDAARERLDEERDGGVLDVWKGCEMRDLHRGAIDLLPMTRAIMRIVKKLPSA